jgi:hypothetical protein
MHFIAQETTITFKFYFGGQKWFVVIGSFKKQQRGRRSTK